MKMNSSLGKWKVNSLKKRIIHANENPNTNSFISNLKKTGNHLRTQILPLGIPKLQEPKFRFHPRLFSRK